MFLIYKNRIEKCNAHLLDPIWMTISLTKNSNFKKDIDKSRGVQILKCEKIDSFGRELGRRGAVWAHTQAQWGYGLQEAFWIPPGPLGYHTIFKNASYICFT